MRQLAKLAVKVRRAGLFDRDWYELTSGRRFLTAGSALLHYLRSDLAQGSPHPLFDPDYFTPRVRAINPNAAVGLAGYIGQWQTRRDPSRFFDESAWLAAHPGALKHPGGPLGHFIANAGPNTIVPGTSLNWQELRSRLEAAARAWSDPTPVTSPAALPLVLITAEYPAEMHRMMAELAERELVIAYSGNTGSTWRQLWVAAPGRCLRVTGDLRAAGQEVVTRLGVAAAVCCSTAVEGLPAAAAVLARHEAGGRVHAAVLHDDYTVHGLAGAELASGLGPQAGHGLHPAQLPPLLPAPTPDWITWLQPAALNGPDLLATGARVLPWRLECGETGQLSAEVEARLRATLPDSGRRWSIEIAAPGRLIHEQWGDFHFASALVAALQAAGERAEIHFRGSRNRPARQLADVNLVLRGLQPAAPVVGRRNLLWVISHPAEVNASELEGFELVFAASQSWAAKRSAEWGCDIRPLLQATDFYLPDAPREHGLVFVGSSRGTERHGLSAAIAAGLELDVYGAGWPDNLPANVHLHGYADNAELPAIYGGASAVICDHWDDMRQEGFIANRVFDVLASGGVAISDDVPGLAELLPSGVRVYRDAAELVELCKSVGQWLPGPAERAETAARVQTEHSFAARVRQLIAEVDRLG